MSSSSFLLVELESGLHGSEGEWLVDRLWVEEILQEFLLGVDLALLEIFGDHGGDGVWDTLAEQGHLLTLLLLVDLGEDLSESLDWLLCLNGQAGKDVN